MSNIIPIKAEIPKELQREFEETDRQIAEEAALIMDYMENTEESNAFTKKRREKLANDFFNTLTELSQ